MHGDVVRLNALIAQNETMSKKLAETNFALEKEFVVELKELESQSVQMEARVAALKDEKAKLLEDILEAERQVLLWEKKIQLEKETQAALDPSVGMAEAAEMEREIHRMKLRAEALKRTQEKLLKDMELAIDKREMISIKVKAKSAAAPVSAAVPATQVILITFTVCKSEDTGGFLDFTGEFEKANCPAEGVIESSYR
jgi:coiled-coil domain-containing protein 40